MDYRPLGQTGLHLSPIGFGAFKIGRNQKTKYPQPYPLPDLQQVDQLLNNILDLGINHIDTAPAYGLSEQRIGQTIAHRREEYILCTKVGESFQNGESAYHFDQKHVSASIENSLRQLKTEVLDIVLIHSNGQDQWIQTQTDCVQTLEKWKQKGLIRAIGLSGKTQQGFELAMQWADVLMVQYHAEDTTHADIIAKAQTAGLGVICKKGLSSGHLEPNAAIRFVLANPHICNLVIGGLNLTHMQENLKTACAALRIK